MVMGSGICGHASAIVPLVSVYLTIQSAMMDALQGRHLILLGAAYPGPIAHGIPNPPVSCIA